jgi:hypothetical protein
MEIRYFAQDDRRAAEAVADPVHPAEGGPARIEQETRV